MKADDVEIRHLSACVQIFIDSLLKEVSGGRSNDLSERYSTETESLTRKATVERK
jgi:hypothetical protein